MYWCLCLAELSNHAFSMITKSLNIAGTTENEAKHCASRSKICHLHVRIAIQTIKVLTKRLRPSHFHSLPFVPAVFTG